MLRILAAAVLVLLDPGLRAETWKPSRERPPGLPREFRGAWVACVYNIDWPSRQGLGEASQKAELRRLLDGMARLNMNAIIFQVRPNADAVYSSRIEPWSPWLTGTMGRSPGYDPLEFCIAEAHARGIEVHAWFNPFRALPNASMPVSSNHVTRTHPSAIRPFKSLRWLDPGSSFARERAMQVILDVVRRYDVDGVHLDDYFYPYPDVGDNGQPLQRFPDGRSEAQRRASVDSFVQGFYRDVKRAKPWVRVGISPFGIWKPGVPAGTTAQINAYDHLAADSRKWLSEGWCDYLSPQLYWRIEGPQSFSKLLAWWRGQGSRPVWPGIATSRIQSSEDPGRPASEILRQVDLTRTIGRNWVGHVHWSAKALQDNRGGVARALERGAYRYPALVPPMPWISRKEPSTPRLEAAGSGAGVRVRWSPVSGAAKYAVQAKGPQGWILAQVVPGSAREVTLKGDWKAVAVSAVDRYGTSGSAAVAAR